MSGRFPTVIYSDNYEETVANLEYGRVDACLILLKISQAVSKYGLKCSVVWLRAALLIYQWDTICAVIAYSNVIQMLFQRKKLKLYSSWRWKRDTCFPDESLIQLGQLCCRCCNLRNVAVCLIFDLLGGGCH